MAEKQLKTVQQKRGYRPDILARRTGFSKISLSPLENSKNSPFSSSRQGSVDALGVTVGDLFAREAIFSTLHTGEAVGTVVAGSLRFALAEEPYRRDPGDSSYGRATHLRWMNPGDEVLGAIRVVPPALC